ncbi:MAG TPA: hypothetical protein VK911_04585 [Vicinamibacterales bacterium]|nr:hypothetical protein [Vicinamibacterales bacterium]
MKRAYPLVLAAFVAFAAAPVSADMTMKVTMSIKGPMPMEMQSTLYIAGMNMRTDVNMGGQEMSMLVDLANKRHLVIEHATKTVREIDPAAAMSAMPVAAGEPSVSIEATGETKQVLGHTCQVFAMRVSMPMTIGDEVVTMVMNGPACLAKEAPGVADYQAFFKAAAAAGISATPLAQGPQSKGMAEMQKALADSGIPLEQEMQMSMEGAGQMAQMMGQMAMGTTIRTTELSTAAIAPEVFAVPAGYTKK